MLELCDLSAHVLVNKIKIGEITAVELVESVLNRIKRVEGRAPTTQSRQEVHLDEFDARYREDLKRVHSYISLQAEIALETAREIDKRLGRGENPGPLVGMPLAVKDIFCYANSTSTAGSRILEEFISPYTATAIERLEKAGAIVIGKTNLDEFGYGSSSESSAFQPSPGNPWNTEYVPGGSSGGSAAAIAAGEAVIALGSDTSGSIRQPAAYCGVVGMKPTYGRVSRYGLIAFGSSLDCVGPITKNVHDAALMMNVMSGPDRHDSTSVNVPVPNYLRDLNEDIAGIRIGISPNFLKLRFPDNSDGRIKVQNIDPEIEQCIYEAAENLASVGAEIIEDVPFGSIDFGIPAYFVISRVEAASNLHRYDGVKYGFRPKFEYIDLQEMYRITRELGFGFQPKLRILLGMYVSAAQYEKGYYDRALRVRTLIRNDFDEAFNKEGRFRCDVLLAPTTPNTAFRKHEFYKDTVMMQYADQLTVIANLAGIPAISIPAGFNNQGLPISIQFFGPYFSEGKLFNVARAFERVTEHEYWRKVKPKV